MGRYNKSKKSPATLVNASGSSGAQHLADPFVGLAREHIEEDAAGITRLLVRDLEVLVAPLLECRIDVRTVGVAHGLDSLVEVRCVLPVQAQRRKGRLPPHDDFFQNLPCTAFPVRHSVVLKER